jgi:hypothetical protein
MPEQWLTVAEAAAAMKVHPRTIERRMVAGKIENRRNDDGQVQVLINLPDAPPPTTDPVSSEAFETVKELANQQVDIAAGSASALIRVAQEQAMRAENQLTLARQDVGRYRQETRWAMAMVAIILILVIGAVGWCARTMTLSQDNARRSADNAADAAQRAQTAQADLSAEHARLDDAIIAKAKAEGELNAYKTELANVVQLTQKRPATQPTSLVGRLTAALEGN